jgi:hypothetical protein
MLDSIPPDTTMDRYGQGGVVGAFEAEMAHLLGKEAALFLPSGTMAQQITLRVHADRRGRRGVVFHPMCHLDWHEGHGYVRLHNLVGIPVGPIREPLRLESLREIHEAPAALLLELPQRDLGGSLPTWDELRAQVEWARERGAAVHMDGARLWEATPYYGKSPAAVAALFDTVYVSFYKGLGAIAGSVVAGGAGSVVAGAAGAAGVVVDVADCVASVSAHEGAEPAAPPWRCPCPFPVAGAATPATAPLSNPRSGAASNAPQRSAAATYRALPCSGVLSSPTLSLGTLSTSPPPRRRPRHDEPGDECKTTAVTLRPVTSR